MVLGFEGGGGPQEGWYFLPQAFAESDHMMSGYDISIFPHVFGESGDGSGLFVGDGLVQ